MSASRRPLLVVTGTLLTVAVCVGVVAGCTYAPPSLSSTATGSSRFRANVFSFAGSGTLTQITHDVQSVRLVVSKRTSTSDPWTGIYDESVSGSFVSTGLYATTVSIAVQPGTYYMLGYYIGSSSKAYDYDSSPSSSQHPPSSCATFHGSVYDGSNSATGQYAMPSSPTSSSTLYNVGFSVSLSGVTGSCPTASSGLICNGFSCVSSGCDCPVGYSAPACEISSTPSSFCPSNGFLTSNSGSAATNTASGSYGNNELCKWTITPSGLSQATTQITLVFSRFRTESRYDDLVIRSRQSTASSWSTYGTYSGEIDFAFSVTLCGYAQLEFDSDGSVVKSGIEFSYTSTTATSCTFSGPTELPSSPTDMSTSGVSSTTSVSSSSGSTTSSATNTTSSSLIIIYVLPGVLIVITMVVLSVYRSIRRRHSGRAEHMDYDPNEDPDTADRVKGSKSRTKEAAAKAAFRRRQGRLSDWKRRNAVELGLDDSEGSDAERDNTDGSDGTDGGSDGTDGSCTYEYEYIEESTTADDASSSGLDDADESSHHKYGKASAKTVRNRFLAIGAKS